MTSIRTQKKRLKKDMEPLAFKSKNGENLFWEKQAFKSRKIMMVEIPKLLKEGVAKMAALKND